MHLTRNERGFVTLGTEQVHAATHASDLPTMTLSFRLKRYWTTMLDWVYPGGAVVCALCNRAIPDVSQRQRTQISAWADVPESLGQLICPFCLQEARDIRPRPIRRHMKVSVPTREQTGKSRVVQIPVYSVFRYEGFVQRAIRPWKYDGALGMTEWFSEGLLSTMAGIHLSNQADGIVPVPTTPERLRQRGYHHTLLLAKSVAAASHLPVLQLLQRGRQMDSQDERAMTHDVLGRETQTAKSAKERRASLAGAFATARGVDLTGSRLLLLDDVVTTGATMEACAFQLLAAGASQVVCLAIADVK